MVQPIHSIKRTLQDALSLEFGPSPNASMHIKKTGLRFIKLYARRFRFPLFIAYIEP